MSFFYNCSGKLLLAALLVMALNTSVKAQSVTLSTTVDEMNGNTGTIALLTGTPEGGGISLREALIACNNKPVGATITINILAENYTLTLTGSVHNAAATWDLDITATEAVGTKTINFTGAGSPTYGVAPCQQYIK